MARKPEHLGDGAYLDDDGFQLWLCANNHRNRVVALEPGVYMNFLKASAVRMVKLGYDKEQLEGAFLAAIHQLKQTEVE